MASDRRLSFLRVGALILGCTLLLTASFVGILAVFSGDVTTFKSRIPWYLLIGAAVFVGTIVLLEENGAHGRTILATALLTTVLAFILVSLGVEGFIFTLENPDTVFVSQLVLYLLAAGLIGTGVGYWGLNHWREFSATGNEARL